MTGAIFFATTPPRLWGSITCDTLSLGFLVLASAGGLTPGGLRPGVDGQESPAVRFGALAVHRIIVLGLALLVAPQCLQSPLNDLDPLLKTYWISMITEAQSIGSSELAANA